MYGLRFLPLAATAAAALASCASIGNPSGGPRDEEPPRFVRANPAPGSVNVMRDKVTIDFDEIVNVKDAFSKVVVSPPSATVPRVSSLGKRISVEFRDSLKPNTTYTIDFANAIEDNNEGNQLQGFTYTFSTGPVVDTLQISGMVLSSDALEPQQGMLVGVYSNLSDTAFSTLPFERVAKTDDRGRFSIKGLAPGNYRIFALGDLDNDYRRANPEEATAFLDYTLTPTATRVETADTLFNLTTGEVDTVVARQRTVFLPNDVLLRSFESDAKPQFLQKYERVDSTRLSLIFNTHSDTVPQVEIVSPEGWKDWAVTEKSVRNDTMTYWIKPKALVSTDSLYVAVKYQRTDSARNLEWVTDTLRFFTYRPKTAKKSNKKKAEADTIVPKAVPLAVKMLSGSSQEVWLPLQFEFATPLERLDTAAFRLETKVDSVWEPVRKPWRLQQADSLNLRRFKIDYPWEYSTDYRLTADSLAAEGIYGLVTDPIEHKFKTKGEEDYSALTFTITGFNDSVPAFVELVNGSDVIARRGNVENGTVRFRFLAPGKYYARIFEDFNGDGVYTTGSLEDNRQPDAVYYYPKAVTLKKNWEKSETWDVFATAVDIMKPVQVLKNKPEADKRRRSSAKPTEEDDEEEEGFDPTRNPFDPNDHGRKAGNKYR